MRSLILCLLVLFTLSLSAEDREFNVGFYYDEEAARNVQRLGGMEMHSHICASQFNQALLSAGVDDVWVNPVLITELAYNMRGDTRQALMRQLVDDKPEVMADMQKHKLDFIIIFVCLPKSESDTTTLGVAVGLEHREGIYDADADHEAEWRKELEDTDIEGAYFQVIKTPVPGRANKVQLSYAYRFLALDLYEAMNSFTFIHELGHLFGAGHSRDQNAQRGPQNPERTPYASGAYKQLTAGGKTHYFCSVMAYNDADFTDSGKQYVQLPMFSSPDPQQIGSHGEHVLGSERDNNARAIRLGADMLAKNRPYTLHEEEVGDDEAEEAEEDEKPARPLYSRPTFSRWGPHSIS